MCEISSYIVIRLFQRPFIQSDRSYLAYISDLDDIYDRKRYYLKIRLSFSDYIELEKSEVIIFRSEIVLSIEG